MPEIANVSPLGRELLDAARIKYRTYAFAVSTDDFDEDRSGGWGPGEYSGVRLGVADAEAWNTGLLAAKDRDDLDLIGRLSLRLHVLRGGTVETWDPGVSDPWLEEVRARREAQVADLRSAQDARQARQERVMALLSGLVSTHLSMDSPSVRIGTDLLPADGDLILDEPVGIFVYAGQYREFADRPMHGGRPRTRIWRLPDGMLVQISTTPTGPDRYELWGTGEQIDAVRPPQWGYAEVAAHLGVAASTVRKYASDGRLPAPDGRVGSTPWWRPETIRAWQAARPGRGVGGGRPRKS